MIGITTTQRNLEALPAIRRDYSGAQLNLITGHLRPDKGAVSFEGRDLVGLPPQKIVRLGIARSFQRINVYPRLTVFENVQVALIAHERQQWNLASFEIRVGWHYVHTLGVLARRGAIMFQSAV